MKKVLITILILVVFSASAFVLVGCTTGKMLPPSHKIIGGGKTTSYSLNDLIIEYQFYYGIRTYEKSIEEIYPGSGFYNLESIYGEVNQYRFYYLDEKNEKKELVMFSECFFIEKNVIQTYMPKQNVLLKFPIELFKEESGEVTIYLAGSKDSISPEVIIYTFPINYIKSDNEITLSCNSSIWDYNQEE